MESATSKTFLFVNKTQSSRVLSRTEGAERVHVQSHSQQARRSRENKAATDVHQPWTVVVLHGAHSRGGSGLKKPRPLRAAATYERCFLPTSSSPAVMEEGSRRGRAGKQQQQQQHLTQCPSRNGSDPFDCSIAGGDISHYHHHVILRFVAGQSPKVTFFAEAWAPDEMQQQRRPRPLPMRHDAAVARRLRACVQDRALMYSTLAYGASLLGWMGGGGGVVDTSAPVEYFTGQAIQAVRERIVILPPGSSTSAPPPRSRLPDESGTHLALSIYSLAISELWKVMPPMQNRGAAKAWSAQQPRRTAPTARMHLRALLELVHTSGGWGAFDPYVLESAILADKYLACWEWTAPTIAVNSLLRADCDVISMPEMDLGSTVLGSKLLAMNLYPRLQSCARQVVQYVSSAQQAWALAPLPFDVQSSLFFRLQRLVYELLGLAGLGAVDECVRVAALLFLQATMLYRGAHICAVILAAQLRPALVSARF